MPRSDERNSCVGAIANEGRSPVGPQFVDWTPVKRLLSDKLSTYPFLTGENLRVNLIPPAIRLTRSVVHVMLLDVHSASKNSKTYNADCVAVLLRDLAFLAGGYQAYTTLHINSACLPCIEKEARGPWILTPCPSLDRNGRDSKIRFDRWTNDKRRCVARYFFRKSAGWIMVQTLSTAQCTLCLRIAMQETNIGGDGCVLFLHGPSEDQKDARFYSASSRTHVTSQCRLLSAVIDGSQQMWAKWLSIERETGEKAIKNKTNSSLPNHTDQCKCSSLIDVLATKLELLSKALTDANTKNAAIWTKVDKELSSLNE
ncbi:hypothetical protein CLF_113565 [Clonorchis sinensis]|uniref:Uncharacterized protein n=1 Tax=Clonorchis sinensis TaxID=79923 RepID=G7YMV6_CLOSI|nr:hypothetical protein CLF_113565 [Clonorchis sinensis]